MRKILLLLSVISVLLIGEAFATGAIDLNVGITSSSATPQYLAGITIKSIGALGIELTVEGNLGNSFDLGKIGSVKKWNLLPTLFISLPTGEIRPYAGIGILTTYDIATSSFGPVNFATLYYKAGVDVFLKAFSFFGEIQGKFTYQPQINVSGIDVWRLGAGLAF
jgi:outer membrane protein W